MHPPCNPSSSSSQPLSTPSGAISSDGLLISPAEASSRLLQLHGDLQMKHTPRRAARGGESFCRGSQRTTFVSRTQEWTNKPKHRGFLLSLMGPIKGCCSGWSLIFIISIHCGHSGSRSPDAIFGFQRELTQARWTSWPRTPTAWCSVDYGQVT